ncbi:WRKY transcription factor 22-like [Phragmites australis]|uniref:WRKY transcription factor 22-like n=1 Tax=Phragmites australis TaxID=29695 RepID=UPI002D785071|nr:WRKY transcription factor 22-like [Phragmites australis]
MEGDLGWCCSSSSNNWDLHAVVRFACGGSGRVAPPTHSDGSSWLPTPQKYELIDGDASQTLRVDPDVDDLCQAFFAATKPETPQPSSPRNDVLPQLPLVDEPPGKPKNSGPTRSKRKSKKRQVNKEVTRVPVGAPAPDLWAWRKYGQKPIKGSPYPRGYYRCSTDKDCKARKQVERCRNDPATLIITYTGDHSHPIPLHRNSLAGTTRNKPQPPSSYPAEEPPQRLDRPSASDTNTKPQGSPSASAGLSPITPLRSPSVEYEDEEDVDSAAVRLLLEHVEMTAADGSLLFLNPDEPGPGQGDGDGSQEVMLFPKTDEPAPGVGNGGDCKDTMMFPKPDELPPTTGSSSRTDGGAEPARS